MYRLPDDHDADCERSASVRFLRNVEALRVAARVWNTQEGAATDEDREVLRLYSGFGDAGVADLAFDYDGRPKGALGALRLRDDWIRGVRRSCLDAFYTPVGVVDAVWKIAERFGGLRGTPLVLEPSCGVGNFLGRAPAHLSASSFVGVEADLGAAAICRALYPARIASRPFEDVAKDLPPFDLVVGNVPFGQRTMHDEELPPGCRSTLHDYFVARSVLALRRGGLAVLLTSTGTLDKVRSEGRAWLAARAELVFAARLPTGSFVGTDADADLLVLRRRDVDLVRADDTWIRSVRLGGAADAGSGWRDVLAAYPELGGASLSSVFVERPDLAVGEWAAARNQYAKVEPIVRWPDDVNGPASDRASVRLARSAWLRREILARAAAIAPAEEPREEAPPAHTEAVEALPPAAAAPPLQRSAERLLKALRAMLAAQLEGAGEDELRILRAVHADFVRRFGRVRDVVVKPFRDTPLGRAWPLLRTLEEVDGSPGPALRRRLVAGAEAPRPLDLTEALYVVLDRWGRVDLDAVAEIMNRQEAA